MVLEGATAMSVWWQAIVLTIMLIGLGLQSYSVYLWRSWIKADRGLKSERKDE